MKKLFVILVFSYITYIVFTTSCANPGMPTGGEKDTIPPVVLKTVPELNVTNYKGNSVSLTFNEFVISDEVGTKLLVSPPVAKKPVVRTKSKTLTIELGDSLRQNVTYTLDFGDAIADNNEKNPLEDFRFAFSTGPQFDSLMVGGYVLDAGNMEPVAEAMVLLYDEADSVSSFRKKIPKYIARTDDEGFYTFTNLAGGKYRLFALEDADGSLSYNQPGERIAFFDSLVTPLYPDVSGTISVDSMSLAEIADSLKTGVDSLLAEKESLSKKVNLDRSASSEMVIPAGLDADSLRPGRQAQKTTLAPHYLLMFKEITFDNFLDNYTRDQRNQVKLYFSNSVTDSFRVNLLSPQPARTDWSYMEYSYHRDSIFLWINDTIVSQTDTLKLQVKYETLDTLSQRTMVSDTLDLIYSEPVKRERKRKEKDEAPVNTNFSLQVNAKDGFDSYAPLVIQSPVPIDVFDYSKIHVYQKIDTIEQILSVKVEQDSILRRKFLIHHPWEFEGSYRLEIDSAAARAFTREVSAPVDQSFKVQKEDFYGIIVMDIKQLPGNCIVQLLKNSENEEVLKEAFINKDGKVEFSFVKPEKYKLRLIVDRNQDGRWNTGELDEWKQPERVVYFSKILKVKSNFKMVEPWVLPADLHAKEVIDEEQDAKDKKDKAGKKEQKQKKSPRKNNF